ncbi:MAG: hypothetical protein M0Z66_16250 [Thermaerobacter sp.]|nr:hypothetical protein [Thermaerobacter sp.]
MRAHGLRLGYLLLLAPLLTGCGRSAVQAPAPPPALRVASSMFANFPAIRRYSSQVLALTGQTAHDRLVISTSGSAGARVRVISGRRTLFRRGHVRAVAIALFGRRHLPVLLFATTGSSVWGYPESSVTYVPKLRSFEPVAFVHPLGGLLVTSELQGFATLTPQGVTVVSPTGPGSSPTPTGSQTTHWVYRASSGSIGEWLQEK